MSIFPKLLKLRIELMFIKVNFQNKKQKQNKKLNLIQLNRVIIIHKEKFKESKLLQFNNEMTSHEQKNFILNCVIQLLSQTGRGRLIERQKIDNQKIERRKIECHKIERRFTDTHYGNYRK